MTLLLFGAALNGIAWMQARAMTHYVEHGERTGKPEKLSLSEKAWIILTGVEPQYRTKLAKEHQERVS